MATQGIKHLINKYELIHNKSNLILKLKYNNNKIEINITTKEKDYYNKEFVFEDFQNIAKYFKIFDSIEDIYADLKLKFEENNYEINLEQIESKIIIKIKTNIYKNNFFLRSTS